MKRAEIEIGSNRWHQQVTQMAPVCDKDVSSGVHNRLNEATDYQVLKNDGFSTVAIGDGQARDPTAGNAF